MASLRRRFQLTTGLLVALQIGSTALAVGTWRGVIAANAREQQIAGWREAVEQLREAIREQYVHEAHTYIEGGTGHLHHEGEVETEVDERLATIEALPLPPEALPALAEVRQAIVTARNHFHVRVVPLAEQGKLDRPTASALHGETEALAGVTAARTTDLSVTLDHAQAAERAAVAQATTHAWQLTVIAAVGSLGLAFVLSRRLGNAVLGPLDQLRRSAVAFGENRRIPAPETGDDEIATVGAAFNAMTAQVEAAAQQRVHMERLAALGEMSAAVAHELMNPLTVLLGHPEMRRPELAPVRAEAEHARRVVDGLLGFARPQADALADVDLAQLAREAALRVDGAAEARQVQVAVRGTAPIVSLSPSAARQVLDNLLANAVHAAPTGSEVEVMLAEGPSVEVRDRGPGIPALVRPRLYEPFATGRADGTGLGLAVCQRIVRAQGGFLEHRDRDGGGTIALWRLRG